ncbi:GNAT family N-acetyltransferase [Lactobacillaceae bacterium Scapto_B20]
MDDQFTIAPITKQDNEALKQIIKAALEEYGDNVPNSTYDDPVLNDLFTFYQQTPKSQYNVVKRNGKVLGGGGVAPYTDEIAEVQKLFLSGETRGHGIGKQLIMMAEQTARQFGFKQLYIETFSNMDAAIGLYEHVGFHRIDQPILPMSHSACDVLLLKDI